MNSNSKRLASQLYFEELLGCTSPADLKLYQDKATEIKLTSSQSSNFQKHCETDCRSFLFKGTISLFSAVSELERGRQTWPIVQLYYATYYFLRAEFLMRNRCTLRANQVFTVLCNSGESIEKVANKGSKSDHTLAISFAKKYLSGIDVLLSQTIGDLLPYEWLMNQRNWYQYKQRTHIDIDENGPFFSFEYQSLLEQVNQYLKDTDPYFCFDPDYAALALPIKRFQLTIIGAKTKNINIEPNAIKALKKFGLANKTCARLLGILTS